jgi:DNA-binding GntR family transcriptional regulator
LVLNEPAQVIVRRRVMLLDGQPVELVDSHYPVTVADGTPLAEMTKISGGAVSLLASLGYHADDVREEITARLPTDSEQDALNIGEHEPVLVLTRVILTSDGRPFEFTVMRMIAQGRHLRYRMAA